MLSALETAAIVCERPSKLLGLVLLLLFAGCADDAGEPKRDPFAAALAPSPVVSAPLPDSSQSIATAAPSGGRAIRGFIRSAEPSRPIAGADPADRAPGRGGTITLDFQGADLTSVVRVMLEDGLRAPFVIDPRVSGTVTIRSNRPLSEAEIVPTLEEILRLNNAALIERSGSFRIVPRAEAGLSAPVVSARDAAARGLTVRVTPLRFVDTTDVAAVLDAFSPVAGQISYDPLRNLVFSIGTEAEQRTINDVLLTLDADYLAGRSFALLPLREGGAGPVSDELAQLFSRPSGEPDPRSQFIPIARMNAVLIVTDRPSVLAQARDIIRFLDQDAGETPRLHVFEVRNRRASELAAILGDIFEAEVNAGQTGSRGAALAPGLSPRRDRTGGVEPGLGLTGGLDSVTRPDDLEAPLTERASAVAAASPDPSRVLATPTVGEGGLSAPAGSERGFGQAGVLRITADESSNAIVALATSQGANALSDALMRLDTQPLQVLLEATLVEVALNDTLEFGVRWFLQSGNFNFSFGDALGAGAANIFPGFNAAFQTDDISVTLSALDEVTDVRILSSPTLMVLDNRIARLQVGDQVPVAVRSASSVEDVDAPVVSETEFRDTGVILEIRPTVNAGGLVVLEIRQEVSDVVEGTGDGTNPTFSQRVVESTVAVQSGETIALAGLIEEGQTLSSEGIPGLSRIPVLGNLFGTKVDRVDRSELLVLIRPFVVRDQREAREATEELRRKITSLVEPRADPGLRPF
ncbi:MAG: type II secretion system secretin GspD [Pseudomonadota bacterium]